MVSRMVAFLGGAAVLAGSHVAAQSSQVVPRIYKDLEGYQSFTYPLSYQDCRFQQVYLGSEVAKNGARITTMWFRQDAGRSQSFSAKKLKLDVTLYTVSITPATMTKSWTANIGSATGTNVYKGTLNIPATTQPNALPAPWAVKVPFSQPYSYSVSKGNLLFETRNTDTYVYSKWAVDCIRQSVTSGGGEEGYVGLGCMGTGGNLLDFKKIDEHSLMPGGSLDTTFSPTNLSSSVAWVGLSTKSFGPVTLPFDLTPLGAPRCMIHTEIFHLVTLPATGKAVWSIPNNAFMVNQLVYIQGAGLATNANALGLVTSECRFAKIGTGSPQDPGVAECIFGLKGRGPYQSGSSLNLGVVVKLDGVFF